MARQNPRRPNKSLNWRGKLPIKSKTKKRTNKGMIALIPIFEREETEAKIMNCDYLLTSDRIQLVNSITLN